MGKPTGFPPFTAAAALKAALGSDDGRYAVLLEHGTLELGLYAPRGEDPQSPHDRDELYVVTHGSGVFRLDDQRHPFGPGDALFVPAGRVHRFEEFSDDFAAWVIFYGPRGGEVPDHG